MQVRLHVKGKFPKCDYSIGQSNKHPSMSSVAHCAPHFINAWLAWTQGLWRRMLTLTKWGHKLPKCEKRERKLHNSMYEYLLIAAAAWLVWFCDLH